METDILVEMIIDGKIDDGLSIKQIIDEFWDYSKKTEFENKFKESLLHIYTNTKVIEMILNLKKIEKNKEIRKQIAEEYINLAKEIINLGDDNNE